MFQKILVCVNEDEFSDKVASIGADVARRFHAEVVILNVLDASRFAEMPYSGLEASEMIDRHSRSLTGRAHRISLALENLKIPNRVIFIPGRTAQTILEVATQEKVDLIVMGGETKGRLRSWFEGNLWSDVSRCAPCNVLRVSPDSASWTLIPPGQGDRPTMDRSGSQGRVNPLGDALS